MEANALQYDEHEVVFTAKELLFLQWPAFPPSNDLLDGLIPEFSSLFSSPETNNDSAPCHTCTSSQDANSNLEQHAEAFLKSLNSTKTQNSTLEARLKAADLQVASDLQEIERLKNELTVVKCNNNVVAEVAHPPPQPSPSIQQPLPRRGSDDDPRDEDVFHGIVANKRVPYCSCICGLKFSSKPLLHQHLKRVITSSEETCSSKDVLACSTCHQTFSSWRPFKSHTLIQHDIINLSNLKVPWRNRVRSNKRQLKKLSCNLCGKGFTYSQSLMNHFKADHLNLNGHQCDLCGKGFFKDNELQRHVNFVHLKLRGEQQHPCEVCGKLLSSKFNLTNHRRSKHGLS